MCSNCPSPFLRATSQNLRFIIGLCFSVCLPKDDLYNGLWNNQMIDDITKWLDLPSQVITGHLTEFEQCKLPSADYIPWNERISMCGLELPADLQWRFEAFRDLFIIVALIRGYDARTKVVFRRMAAAMELPWTPRVSELEGMVAGKAFEKMMAEIAKHDTSGSNDKWRYVKIGAAAIGGGAVLAITGGLAAPALAAGIAASSAIIGTTAAATLSVFATVPILVSLFGATGVGLVGHKMNVRTKGLTEFKFERDGKSHEMTVCLCIPGLLRDEFDVRRAWGIDPKGISAKERLERFYHIFDPAQVDNVSDLLRIYKGREIVLCQELKEKYGFDPRKPLTPTALNDISKKRTTFSLSSRCSLNLNEDDVDSLVTNILELVKPTKATPDESTAHKKIGNMKSTIFNKTKIHRDNPKEDSIFPTRDINAPKQDSLTASDASTSSLRTLRTDGEMLKVEDYSTIDIDGLVNKNSPVWFWEDIVRNTEQHILVWESPLLVKLGRSVARAVKDASIGAFQQGLKFTALSAVVTAVSLPVALISLTDIIDSDWTVGCERADKAGKVLADILLSKKQGSRPVTLIGTSLGARLIFSCLEELVRRHELWESFVRENGERSNVQSSMFNGKKSGRNEDDASCAAGIVENAFLFGTPVTASWQRWERISRMVHGRLVNGYSKSDGILSLIYRVKRMSFHVAGLQEIASSLVENIDLSSIITQHMQYCSRVPEIMTFVDIDDCKKYIPRNPTFISRDDDMADSDLKENI